MHTIIVIYMTIIVPGVCIIIVIYMTIIVCMHHNRHIYDYYGYYAAYNNSHNNVYNYDLDVCKNSYVLHLCNNY